MENKQELIINCVKQLRTATDMLEKITHDERPRILIEGAIRCVKDKCGKILPTDEELEAALEILTQQISEEPGDDVANKIGILSNFVEKFIDKNIK